MACFDAEKYLQDVEKTCKAINAPYSESMTREVISAYSQAFQEEAVFWRTRSRQSDSLIYRVCERRSMSILGVAMEAGFLQHYNALAWLLASLSVPWGEGKSMVPELCCDFDAEKGLTKGRSIMSGLRPLNDILGVENIPAYLTRHRNAFQFLSLGAVWQVAVDFRANTVSLYFHVSCPISNIYANGLVELLSQEPREPGDEGSTNGPSPDGNNSSNDPSTSRERVREATSADMRKYLSPEGFTFTVTIGVNTGHVKQVAFGAPELAPKMVPEIGDRLKMFLSTAPRHEEVVVATTWSFETGKEGSLDVKKSYGGALVPLLKDRESTV